VIIDGVYRARNGVGFGDLGEIERIEILEGPQGELFGKNNDAGVINVVTKRPSNTFGVTAEATYGNYNDREISASVTGPLGDISAARFYAGYQRRDGFLNVDTGTGPNTENNTDDRNDGDHYTVKIYHSVIRGNLANEGGGAIFFVSDNLTGRLRIQDSTLHDNPSAGFYTAGYPGIFFAGAGHPDIIHSTVN
jgi:outer membrane receptor protein involved in Fe transport